MLKNVTARWPLKENFYLAASCLVPSRLLTNSVFYTTANKRQSPWRLRKFRHSRCRHEGACHKSEPAPRNSTGRRYLENGEIFLASNARDLRFCTAMQSLSLVMSGLRNFTTVCDARPELCLPTTEIVWSAVSVDNGCVRRQRALPTGRR